MGLEALELVLHLLPDVAASPDAYDALTAREQEVLLLAPQRMTGPDIGIALASAAGRRRRIGPTRCAN